MKENIEKISKAERYLASIEGKPHAEKNIGQYYVPCAILIEAYKEALMNAIKPSHKHLSARNEYGLISRNRGVFVSHLASTYSIEKEMSLEDGLKLQISALKGKPNKAFVRGIVASAEKYLVNKAKTA
jgi:hypothetical protein